MDEHNKIPLENEDDLYLGITIRHKGKKFPVCVIFKKEEQSYNNVMETIDGLVQSIRVCLLKNEIIPFPYDGDAKTFFGV